MMVHMLTSVKSFVSLALIGVSISTYVSPLMTSAWAADAPPNRVASIYISQDFINEQFKQHSKSEMVKNMAITLDPDKGQIFFRGELHVPVEEIRAINLDPKLGHFRFQLALKLETTPEGYLIVEFPINETYLYPVMSKTPEEDRVIIPVQMMSLVLASVRGYLAALSGDFSGFDRQALKLEDLLKTVDHELKLAKNPDVIDELKTQKESLRLQIEAIPVERKQLEELSKQYAKMLGFTGEKELSLNKDLGARKNALILKIKISQLAPMLEGVDLGGIRIRHDKKDGGGENYLAIDVNAKLENPKPAALQVSRTDRPGAKIAPSLILRLNQSLFESEAIVEAEKKEMNGKLKEFDLQLKDDGLHVSGKYHTLLFVTVPFDTLVDFQSTGPDVFEAKVRDVKIAGLDFSFLTKFVLESLKKRLNKSMKGMCKFKYVGNEDSPALQVSISPKDLIPAFPDLHLVEVDVRDQEFLLKIGHIADSQK